MVKTKRLSDEEMMRTFNCGVGFCLIVPKNNVEKIKKYFSKNYLPYEIGYISVDKKKLIYQIHLNGKKKYLYFYIWTRFKS